MQQASVNKSKRAKTPLEIVRGCNLRQTTMDCLNFPFTPTRISLQSVAATLCNSRFMKSCQTLNFLVYITLTATFVQRL